MTDTLTIPGILLRVDGGWEDVRLSAGSQLQDFYRLIGCRAVTHIAMDDMPGGADMWCDDEGLLVSEPVRNVLATFVLFRYAKLIGSELTQWIHGDVVITGSDTDGATQGLQDITRAWLMQYLPPQN